MKLRLLCIVLLSLSFCNAQHLDVAKQLQYCTKQTQRTISEIPSDIDVNIPRSISGTSSKWRFVGYKDWTSGFWPGILWYVYEATKDTVILSKAKAFTEELKPLAYNTAYDHDLGFQMFCSYGNGYRLTHNNSYRKILLATADTLATLYNPKVRTILSWPREVATFGAHNTIMDNMINLELLFWASKNGGSKRLYEIAVKHAKTTMLNHFRPDYSGYHVILYDSISGKRIKGITHQGYSDSSMWARGQSWAIYGFTMCYRETKRLEFLDFAQKVADVYLKRLPKDFIPYWDFDVPNVISQPKDASAACVTASALLELSTLVKDKHKAKVYRIAAEKMLTHLSTDTYMSKGMNSAFLLHSTGHKPNNSEIDASIIYADYYYIEALLRLQKLNSKIKH